MVVPVTTIRRGTVPRRMAGTVAGHDMGAGSVGHGYRDLILTIAADFIQSIN
jgi:hypothetical protein